MSRCWACAPPPRRRPRTDTSTVPAAITDEDRRARSRPCRRNPRGRHRLGSRGSVNVFAGQKWYSEDEWRPIETQPEIGVQLHFGQLRAPIYFAVDVFYAHDDTT